MCIFFVFFFFKQKTAYEMRISDWVQTCALPIFGEADAALRVGTEFLELALAAAAGMDLRLHDIERPGKLLCGCNSLFDAHRGHAPGDGNAKFREQFRSEEHTSELQSLMRISYAVFCLKKKTKTQWIDVHKNITTD